MKQHLIRKLEILDKEREDMYRSVEELNEEQLHDPAYGWCVIQVFSHLNISEMGSVLYMRKKMLAGDEMPNFSFLSKVKLRLTKGLLQGSSKWKAPEVVAHPEGGYSLEEMKNRWAETRAQTKAFVSEFPDRYLHKAVYKHPIAGRLNLAGAIDSFIYHQRRHMHQLGRIKNKISK